MEAGVVGTNGLATVTVASLTASATDNATIRAVGVSAGVATGSGGTVGGAFTIGINIISTASGVFPSGASEAVTATINNAKVTTTGAVALTADDNSVIQSIAGALGVGTEASAFGVGLSWNEVALDINATVDDATVGAGSLSLLAESTQNNNIIDGKISTAAVGGAVSTSGSAAVAASVSVNGVQNVIDSGIIDGASVTTSGDIDVTASDEATIRDFVGGVAIAADGTAWAPRSAPTTSPIQSPPTSRMPAPTAPAATSTSLRVKAPTSRWSPSA